MAQVDRRPGEAVSVALLDLDDFKRINDEEGHQAGDRVLRGVAAEVRGHIRRGDYLVRLGGEEFLIVFPGMRAEAAYALSDGLRERIPAVTDGLSRRPVTASIGLVQYRGGETAGQLLGRADVLMYAAKTGGKNRVCRDGDVGDGLSGQTEPIL
ncbi:GGDEF domain-containing protein [Acidihalobacter prosperus]